MKTHPPTPAQIIQAAECGFILNHESRRLCRRIVPSPADPHPVFFTADMLPLMDLSDDVDSGRGEA